MIFMKFHHKTFLSRKLKLGKFPWQLAFFVENRAEEGGKFVVQFVFLLLLLWGNVTHFWGTHKYSFETTSFLSEINFFKYIPLCFVCLLRQTAFLLSSINKA